MNVVIRFSANPVHLSCFPRRFEGGRKTSRGPNAGKVMAIPPENSKLLWSETTSPFGLTRRETAVIRPETSALHGLHTPPDVRREAIRNDF